MFLKVVLMEYKLLIAVGVGRLRLIGRPTILPIDSFRRSISGAGPIRIFGEGEGIMSIGTILLIVLVLILVGALPTWPYASSWGYGPSGLAGIVVVVLIVLLLMGRL
jgi:hypothetical protein